ncbi:MAG: pyrroline-5-carboxylate reductase [Pyrinomonadaceae bacterium]|nr:pyrroline-5-carboxylate reductase [Acidobacteriota bacterium]MBK7932277.1 pyrroline-5-carboxylate reductase [Acidobacteriota bacterium]MBP7375378.1 pyrroline-5-carboxylate reductase [Pyrinomonadaceae bacterium]
MSTKLNDLHLAFIGCGVMGESMVAGLLRRELVDPKNIAASHPRESRRSELTEKYGIAVFESNAEAAKTVVGQANSAVLICVKPQRLARVLSDLTGVLHLDQLVLSIVAGARIEHLADELGTAKIVRAMPNTPSQIGAGITAWTCTDAVVDAERGHVREILAALGKELFVETENMIDMATSLSATGPTYIFMVMEALTDAGVHLGFSRDMAKELVQETMLGSVKFAMESHRHPAELRNMVTSPGGTSAEAIYQMEKGSLRTVLSKAVYAAYKRAVDLGKKG